MAVLSPPALMVDEFFNLHGGEPNVDLVRGQVVRRPMPGSRHGVVSLTAGSIVRDFVRANKLGRAMFNDTHVRISDNTALGADVCFVSYQKLPPGPSPDGMLEVPPDLVIKVRSPSDLWTDLLAKVIDHLRAGVTVVVVLDPKTESASVFRSGDRQDIVERDETLTIPVVLPGFAVPVARFFEE